MRKGILELGLTIWVLIALVVLLVGYYTLFVFTETAISFDAEQVIKGDRLNTMSLNLRNLLRTPVKIGGEAVTISDLIISSYNKNDYSELEYYLDKIFSQTDFYWYISFYDASTYDWEKGDSDPIHYLSRPGWVKTIKKPGDSDFLFASQILPNVDGDDIIVLFSMDVGHEFGSQFGDLDVG